MSAPYSFMEHLARSILFSRYKDNALMAMYSAYFDASGHPAHTKVLTVAGFSSTVKKWSRFDRQWGEILKSEGIKVFHMTDFVSSEGEFAEGWKGETDRRRDFIERLALCLQTNVNKAFRTTLILDDYSSVNKVYELEETLGRPYALCSMTNVLTLREWAERKRASRELLYFFEDGDKDKGDFENRHKSKYGVKPKFLDKTEAVAFQAADFAGWKIRDSVQHSIKDGHTLEKGMKLLNSVKMLRKIPKAAGVVNAKTLTTYCQENGVKKRVLA